MSQCYVGAPDTKFHQNISPQYCLRDEHLTSHELREAKGLFLSVNPPVHICTIPYFCVSNTQLIASSLVGAFQEEKSTFSICVRRKIHLLGIYQPRYSESSLSRLSNLTHKSNQHIHILESAMPPGLLRSSRSVKAGQ